MEFLVALLLLLLVTRLAGELFRRAGQAPLIGEVLAGIVVGPAVLAWVIPDAATDPLADVTDAGGTEEDDHYGQDYQELGRSKALEY